MEHRTRMMRARAWVVLVSFTAAAAASDAKREPTGPPYFNFERRHFLIEGSYAIVPTQPLEVGRTRQLFVGRRMVDTTWNLFRTVHRPERYRGNPLIEGGAKAWRVDWGTVLYDEAARKFRLWTRAYTDRPKWDQQRIVVYYESDDGIRWRAPELGLVPFDGSRANNIIMGEKGIIYGNPSVSKVPARLASKGRYVMLYSNIPEHPRPGRSHNMDEHIAWSEDGIRWRDQPENPILRGRNDTFQNMIYNPERDVFMIYRRATVNAHEIRRIAYSESPDLVHWTQPEAILDPDEIDVPMFYDFIGERYQSAWIGFLNVFYAANAGYVGSRFWRDGQIDKEGKVDVELAWSRDGKEWERHPRRPVFLETSPRESDCYDCGMVYMWKGVVDRGDRIYLYYRGDGALHHGGKGTYGNFSLATLRKDGFVSFGTPAGALSPGYLLTRPLACPGGRLHVNAATKPGGFVKIAVRRGDGDKDGDYLEGWNFDQGAAFTGDSTGARMDWKGKADFESLKGRSIRLHFWLQDAEIYSFWFE